VVTLLVVQLDVQEMTKVTLMVAKLGTLVEAGGNNGATIGCTRGHTGGNITGR